LSIDPFTLLAPGVCTPGLLMVVAVEGEGE
jgi:hypothetical protein